MPENKEITAEEYEEYKKLKCFESEISENYYHLYMQVLHMRLLITAYAENDDGDYTYNPKEIFDFSESMYSSSLKIRNFIHQYHNSKDKTGG